MAVTMEKIKFYRPSLPVRPTKKSPPNHRFPIDCHSPDRAHSSIPTPQPVLHYPLPPRPPVTVPLSTASQSVHTLLPTSSPVYLNDFDRAIEDVLQEAAGIFIPGEGRKDEGRGDLLIPKGQGECEVNSGNLSCSTLEGYPSSPIASPTPTTDTVFAQLPNTDLVPHQTQDHENLEVWTGNTEPMSSSRSMTRSVSSEEPVSTFVSTDIHLNNSIPRLSFTPGPISTREGKAERYENSPTSVILDSQYVEASVQSVPHNEEAHQHTMSMVSEKGITCQPDEPISVQDNMPASVSSLPSIAVVMPVSSRSPSTSSKRPPSSSQCDLEPLLREDDSDSTPSDDEDDADYIFDDDVPEADQQPLASKRRKISPSARSSPISRETRLSKKLCPVEPVQQDLRQAVEYHQTSSAPSEDVYCFTGLLSYLSRMPLEDRLQFVSWLCEGALTRIMSDTSHALSPTPASTAERSRKSGWSSSKPRENKPWKPEEKDLLRQLKKEEHLSWSAIEERFAEKFPKRRIGAVKLHWYTKLKDES